MILIFSKTETETTTEEVMDWLERLGASFFRLNGEDLERGSIRFEISGNDTKPGAEVGVHELRFSEVQTVWFRRWIRKRKHESVDLLAFPDSLNGKLQYDIRRHLTLESQRLSRFLFSRFAGLPWLSAPDTSDIDKLRALEIAIEAGLTTPATLVTSERSEVQAFANRFNSLITKPIGEVEMLLDGERVHYMYTAALDRAAVDALPAHFAPSLFQEKVEKEFEIRAFYLDGACDAMAIFSQLDPQTQSDFRQYNFIRPNRYVPYRLSPTIIDQFRRLMASLKLATGSLDLIRTPDGRNVFLEVNPIGQLGMVSKPCNYQLEWKLAEALIWRAEHGREP